MDRLRRSLEVLLIEDNPADARLTKEALTDGNVARRVSVASDGVEALQFLRRGEAGFANAPRPDLILLDLDLAGKSGREVLEEIKADPDLRRIPVVVLTDPGASEDLQQAYRLYANCCIEKPADRGEFPGVVRSIEHFWFSIVTLPTR